MLIAGSPPASPLAFFFLSLFRVEEVLRAREARVSEVQALGPSAHAAPVPDVDSIAASRGVFLSVSCPDPSAVPGGSSSSLALPAVSTPSRPASGSKAASSSDIAEFRRSIPRSNRPELLPELACLNSSSDDGIALPSFPERVAEFLKGGLSRRKTCRRNETAHFRKSALAGQLHCLPEKVLHVCERKNPASAAVVCA